MSYLCLAIITKANQRQTVALYFDKNESQEKISSYAMHGSNQRLSLNFYELVCFLDHYERQ